MLAIASDLPFTIKSTLCLPVCKPSWYPMRKIGLLPYREKYQIETLQMAETVHRHLVVDKRRIAKLRIRISVPSPNKQRTRTLKSSMFPVGLSSSK